MSLLMETSNREKGALDALLRTFINNNLTGDMAEDELEALISQELAKQGYDPSSTGLYSTIMRDLGLVTITVMPRGSDGLFFHFIVQSPNPI